MKFIIVTLVFAIPAFLLSRVLWPDTPGFPVPSPEQLPFFIFLSVVEVLLFGLGIAFLLFGWPLVERTAGENKTLNLSVFISIVWGLISWWPHSNFHRTVGLDLSGLLVIEYAFHLTLIISTLVIATYFWKQLRRNSA